VDRERGLLKKIKKKPGTLAAATSSNTKASSTVLF
jgi:hypothetical protein